MANYFSSIWRRASGMLAAAAQPGSGGSGSGQPKVKPGQATVPSYLTTAKPNPGSALLLRERALANTDMTAARSGATGRTVLRDLRMSSPDLSAAASAYLRVGIPERFQALAYNLDKTPNEDATRALAYLISSMDVLNDYTLGFDGSPSIRAASESMALELVTYGSTSAELVLNRVRMPDFVQPVSTSQIRFYPSADGKRKVPHQRLGGEEIVLNQPTFFYVSLDQDLLDPYSTSPIETAVQGVLFSGEFLNDVRRVVHQVIHPRNIVSINEEKFLASVPLDIKADQAKLDEYLNGVLFDLQSKINGLSPEEALVLFDTIGITVLDRGSSTLSKEYEVIQGIGDARLLAGTKTLPTVLGRSSGTSNVASTEALLYVKTVDGTVRSKLNEIWSKILTLGVRLYGFDVYVDFKFDEIDLRPRRELEAFITMEQSRILDLLSLGMIDDITACMRLTGNLPPPGYVNKSGTGFRASTSTSPTGNGYNGASNSGSTLNQNLSPDTPTGKKGGQSAQIHSINSN